MKRVIPILLTASALAIFAAPAFAQGRSAGRATVPPAHPPTAAQGRGTTVKPPTTKPPTTKPPTTKPPTGKPPTTGKPATTTGKPAMAPMTASQHLAMQPKLSANLQRLLPAGANLQLASAGFKNLGAFVSAVHVSNNLGIPFDQLKAKITGTTSVSLGQAIQELKPTANASVEVKRANAQAKKDMEKGDGK